MEIVTGSTGEVHVTPIDDAVRNSNVGYLNDKVVFTCFDNFAATVITNNEVRISSGYGINQGRIFKIDDQEYDSVTIENGSQGYKRADLIVARYTMDTQTGFEDISLEVIRGNSGSTYIDPSYSTGDINGGDIQDDFPLYRVKLNGLNIEAVESMFTLVPDGGRMGELEAQVRAHKTAFDALNVRANLASESAVYLKNGANARPGVEGILPASHGGTGQTTLKSAANSLNSSLDSNTSNPSTNDTQDANTYYIGTTQGGTIFHKKPLSALKEWVAAFIETRGYGDMTKMTFTGSSEGTVIRPENGGTGQLSLQATRNAMGLGNTTGALPIANGGTGQTTAAGIRNAIGLGNSTGVLAAANGGTGQSSLQATRNAMGLGNTTGALPVANGGTGLTASPSMLTNLGSTTAASVMQASPRPGITGTLAIAHGGTGATSASAARTALGVPPTNHASTATTYGVGDASNYGHVKITDDIQEYRAGFAAKPTMVADVYERLLYLQATVSNNYMPKSGDTFTGNVIIDKGGSNTGEGWSRLYLGNATKVGKAGNQTGVITLYSTNGSLTNIAPNDNAVSGTVRLPASAGTLALASSSSSRRVKENIKDMSEDKAKKLLDINVVDFDYIGDFGGGLKNQCGVIAEDTLDIIPEAVEIAKRYDESKPVDEEKNPAPSVDYRKFIPYLIKMVQIQQHEIEELKSKLS